MAFSNALSTSVPIFTGTHYHIRTVKMKVVETDEDPPAPRQNITIAQLKAYDEEILKKDKALTCFHFGLVDNIFTSIMDLETPKAVWDELKETYEGGDKVKENKTFNSKKRVYDAEMKEDELIKDYSTKLMVVEKVMINVPQRFEAKILAIEESSEMMSLAIIDLVSKLEAQNQRVSMRVHEASEGVFLTVHRRVKFSNSGKKFDISSKGNVVVSSTMSYL
ncbi:hypothetical protein J1N35_005273 [Gossypium stocksii]|uniref:Uncharacterized protein n=1 Tax=Gossypium stocksii TaxID=47602 RepID=A0A9D3WE72_9ROSI|nr:hypothetical protein J1N35_005273 [Gossypium stocksii]